MAFHRWRTIVVVLGLGAALSAIPATARAQSGEERIRKYQVSITVQRDGSLAVDEVIDYDFGSNPRHGIFRDIPVRFHFDDRYDRVMPVEVLSVRGSPGTPDGYKLQHQGSLLPIRPSARAA